jgi:hypothetical protein
MQASSDASSSRPRSALAPQPQRRRDVTSPSSTFLSEFLVPVTASMASIEGAIPKMPAVLVAKQLDAMRLALHLWRLLLWPPLGLG